MVGARIFTSTNGEALDVFYVQDASGAAFGGENDRSLARLVESLEHAGRGEPPLTPSRRDTLVARSSPFAISATVAVDNEASHHATVIEASGRDRPGLLEAVARALTEQGLSIQSAHIDGYGEQAVDTFYVVDANGAKVTDPPRLAAVRAKVVEVLTAADSTDRESRLPKARASSVR